MLTNIYHEMEKLTVDLVSVSSVNKAVGEEKAIAEKIHAYYENLDYFQANPSKLFYQKTKEDILERFSVISFLKGTKGGGSNKTVILLSHIDTVGTEDFGDFSDFATRPSELPLILKKHFPISEEVIKDIDSEDYLFGRGALDMKSGLAGHMLLVKFFSENPELISGNIVAIHACDEEDSSKGVISCLDVLMDLKQKEGLEYVACINADYTTNRSPDDKNYYVYFGSIGKYLPTCSVFGKEAHVGQPFAAFDPNLLTAVITKNMSLNTELSDFAQGELTVPPISLKQTDLKIGYTVQTAIASQAYYNVFSHGKDSRKVLSEFLSVVNESYDEVLDLLDKRYEEYCKKANINYSVLPWNKNIVTWEELYKEIASSDPEFKKELNAFKRQLHEREPEMDMREFSHHVVQFAWRRKRENDSGVVVYFGSILNSPIETNSETKLGEKLMTSVRDAIEKTDRSLSKRIKERYFYPYISDSSFMAVSGDTDSHSTYINNLPSWGEKYIHPFDKIQEINVPVVNIGPHGKDGHMLTERLEKKYSFETVPNITANVIRNIL